MDFSLLVPTRNRPNNIVRFVESVAETSSDESTIEILFYVDADDENTKNATEAIEDIIENKPNIKYSMMGDSVDWYNKWWNYLWQHCSGKYIMQCGDDLIFRTDNWDVEIKKSFNQYPDPFVVIYCDDGSDDAEDRATHPVLSKEWCDELGYFVPGKFLGAYNDTWITEVAQYANRFHYVPHVLIEHMHPDFKKSEIDEVYSKQIDMVHVQNAGQVFKDTKQERINDSNKIINKIRDKQ